MRHVFPFKYRNQGNESDLGGFIILFVCSLGMLMYNTFYRIIPSLIIASNGIPEDIILLAHRVANGYRPQLNSNRVPVDVNAVIEACWHGVAAMRPSAIEVLGKLEKIDLLNGKGSSLLHKRSTKGGTGGARPTLICCCVI